MFMSLEELAVCAWVAAVLASRSMISSVVLLSVSPACAPSGKSLRSVALAALVAAGLVRIAICATAPEVGSMSVEPESLSGRRARRGHKPHDPQTSPQTRLFISKTLNIQKTCDLRSLRLASSLALGS